jgi:predicted metal-dependent phosphoesterase TrpH
LHQDGDYIKADLHTHTYYSDGKYSPAELVERAGTCGIRFLSITDHDNVDGIEEAIETANQLGIELIPGVELSSEHKDREVHILGYFFDYKNPELQEYLIKFRQLRLKRAEKIVEKLNTMSIPLKMADVLLKTKGNASIGRPHIAIALLENNYIGNYYEAFVRYIGDNKPAYEKKPNISTKEAINLIANAGGLSFIAHPGKAIRDEMLIEIIELGIDGIEVIHPSHSSEMISYFQDFVGQYFLLESGGSDFHGGRLNDDSVLGSYWVLAQKITAMKNRLFLNK